MDDNMNLPNSVQEIANVIGREQALLLVGALPRSYSRDKRYPSAKNGTTVMYVPTLPRLGVAHRLVQILGWQDATKLCKAFGGEIMYPASCAFLARQFLNDSILVMARTGAKSTVVADHFGVSERHVRNLVRENPPEECGTAANDNAGNVTKKAEAMNHPVECAA